MSNAFTGVWGTFEFLDDMCSAIKDLRSAGFTRLTTHAPCPRHEIDHALGNPQSRVPFWTLTGMFVGFGLAVLIIVVMSLDWIIPVSAKPIVSVPIMGPVVFELSVIMAIYFTMLGTVLLIMKDAAKHPIPASTDYRQYNRFMRDRFGVVVPCSQGDLEKVESIFKKYQAEEVNREN